MLLVMMNIVVVGFLLGGVYLFAYVLVYIFCLQAGYKLTTIVYVSGYVVAAVFALIGATGCGGWILRLFINGRLPTEQEYYRIMSLITQVGNKAQLVLPKKLCLLISGKKLIEAAAHGRNTIILSGGLLDSCDDSELEAVLAHKVWYLHNKKGLVLTAIAFSNLPVYPLMWLSRIGKIIPILASKIAGKYSALVWLVYIVVLCPLLPIVLSYWLAKHVLTAIIMAVSKRYEYAADKFVVQLGLKEELISYLKKIELINDNKHDILSRINSPQAIVTQRISVLTGQSNAISYP